MLLLQMRVQRLKPHLGCTLFQFPPAFAIHRLSADRGNLERLRQLGSVLQRGERFVFEFRHPSWFCQEVYDVLQENDWCLAMSASFPTVLLHVWPASESSALSQLSCISPASVS